MAGDWELAFFGRQSKMRSAVVEVFCSGIFLSFAAHCFFFFPVDVEISGAIWMQVVVSITHHDDD